MCEVTSYGPHPKSHAMPSIHLSISDGDRRGARFDGPAQDPPRSGVAWWRCPLPANRKGAATPHTGLGVVGHRRHRAVGHRNGVRDGKPPSFSRGEESRAPRHDAERLTGLRQLGERQPAEPLDEEHLGHRGEVVERQSAGLRHAVVGVQEHLGRDAAHGASGRHGQDRVQVLDRSLAGEHEVGPALGGRRLGPPDLTPGYHGSSSIDAAARATTSGPGGVAGQRR